jgi:putative CocE/NonD family hydrolase
VLTFQTSPLEEAVEVAGPLRVELWVSSEAKDTDFTAKLVDVYPPSADYPDGYAMNLEDGILRMRFRNTRTREELIKPGTVYPVTIDLWATANRFAPGHRIRLDISSSNFPMYDLNPNTGEPLGRHTHVKRTLNSVYHDGERLSALLLSVRTP